MDNLKVVQEEEFRHVVVGNIGGSVYVKSLPREDNLQLADYDLWIPSFELVEPVRRFSLSRAIKMKRLQSADWTYRQLW